jgi:hypothetical protein
MNQQYRAGQREQVTGERDEASLYSISGIGRGQTSAGMMSPHSEVAARGVEFKFPNSRHGAPFVPIAGQYTNVIPFAPGDGTKGTQEQFREMRDERDALLTRLEEHRDEHIQAAGQAAANDIAMFILDRVVEADGLDLDTINDNLLAPYGWLAFALLWRARLIDCIGQQVVPTEDGYLLMAKFNSIIKGESVHDA